MDFVKMAMRARHNIQPAYLPVKRMTEKEKMGTVNIDLDVAIGDLIKTIKLDGKDADQKRLDAYCCVLRYFLELGSAKQLIYKMLISDKEISEMQGKWKADSYTSVFLIMEQQLLTYFFKHQEDGFLHAWHIIVKFGVCELGFAPEKIEENFAELFPL